MSEVTGTQTMPPATPLVVPPLGAGSSDPLTGSATADAPATPLVVPPMSGALSITTVSVTPAGKVTSAGILAAGLMWLVNRRDAQSG